MKPLQEVANEVIAARGYIVLQAPPGWPAYAKGERIPGFGSLDGSHVVIADIVVLRETNEEDYLNQCRLIEEWDYICPGSTFYRIGAE